MKKVGVRGSARSRKRNFGVEVCGMANNNEPKIGYIIIIGILVFMILTYVHCYFYHCKRCNDAI